MSSVEVTTWERFLEKITKWQFPPISISHKWNTPPVDSFALSKQTNYQKSSLSFFSWYTNECLLMCSAFFLRFWQKETKSQCMKVHVKPALKSHLTIRTLKQKTGFTWHLSPRKHSVQRMFFKINLSNFSVILSRNISMSYVRLDMRDWSQGITTPIYFY